MKKLALILVCILTCATVMAKPPHLEVEKLFDGSYNTDKSVSIHISKSRDKYFRGFTVDNNSKLVKKVTALFKKDVERAEKSHDIIANGGTSYSSMEILNNGLVIQIGISYSSDNTCYLFITGPEEAFK